jgi:hypothetical protein
MDTPKGASRGWQAETYQSEAGTKKVAVRQITPCREIAYASGVA